MSHTILLVEDNPDDVLFMTRAFIKAGIAISLQTVDDGRKAIDYLSGKKQYVDRAAHPIPQLVLLDLKLPKVSGFEVLQWIRTQPEFVALTVVVLSSSDHPADVKKSHALGANSFVTKPLGPEGLMAFVRGLADTWLGKELDKPQRTAAGTSN